MSRLADQGNAAEVSPDADLSLEAGKRWLERRDELNRRCASPLCSALPRPTLANPVPPCLFGRLVSFTILVHRARAQASSRDETLLYSSLAGAAAGVVGAGAGFAVQKTYFPVKTLGGMRAFFVMWTAFMPYMLVKGVTQNKMQKAARAAAVRD